MYLFQLISNLMGQAFTIIAVKEGSSFITGYDIAINIVIRKNYLKYQGGICDEFFFIYCVQ